MNLKLFTAVAIFATAHMVAFAQIMTRPVVQTISSDKTKLQAYCELGKLPDQTQKAEDRNDTKAVDALVAKADPLAQQIGPEYLKIVEGLEQVDPNSAEGQRICCRIRASAKSANSNESDQRLDQSGSGVTWGRAMLSYRPSCGSLAGTHLVSG
jgi:hypothetical protein